MLRERPEDSHVSARPIEHFFPPRTPADRAWKHTGMRQGLTAEVPNAISQPDGRGSSRPSILLPFLFEEELLAGYRKHVC